MAGRDPALWLLPLLGSGAVANLWPAFERFMNITFSILAGILAAGTVVFLVWAFWGPLPSKGDRW